jgi:hypothetical protein
MIYRRGPRATRHVLRIAAASGAATFIGFTACFPGEIGPAGDAGEDAVSSSSSGFGGSSGSSSGFTGGSGSGSSSGFGGSSGSSGGFVGAPDAEPDSTDDAGEHDASEAASSAGGGETDATTVGDADNAEGG